MKIGAGERISWRGTDYLVIAVRALAVTLRDETGEEFEVNTDELNATAEHPASALGSWRTGPDATVYPKWQFTDQTDDGLLPHLALVVTWLLEDWHPASVEGFMTTPKDSLIYRGEWQTPKQWLLQGAEPRPIEMILEGERWR